MRHDAKVMQRLINPLSLSSLVSPLRLCMAYAEIMQREKSQFAETIMHGLFGKH
jgi:hypothetical protein